MASSPPVHKVRPKVQDFLLSCEVLLATAEHPPLSDDELQIVKTYMEELAKMASDGVKGDARMPSKKSPMTFSDESAIE